MKSQDICLSITSCRVYVKDSGTSISLQLCDRTEQTCGQCVVLNPSIEKYPCIGKCVSENVCGSYVEGECPPGSVPLCTPDAQSEMNAETAERLKLVNQDTTDTTSTAATLVWVYTPLLVLGMLMFFSF